jgi:type IV pilus assembly protein PilM
VLVKKILAVDIGSIYIKLIYTKGFTDGANTIKVSGVMELPTGAVNWGNIIDTSIVAESISKFIKDKKISPSEVSFVIHGRDVGIRYIEVPKLDSSNIRKAIYWDINQYHRDNIENYIVDFKIIDTINDEQKKAYRVLTALVSKEKVNNYIDISEKLGLKLKSIDLSSNCISRTLNHLSDFHKESQNLAIIDIGFQSTQFFVFHKDRIFAEKEIDFGMQNMIYTISSELNISFNEAYRYLKMKLNIAEIIEKDSCASKITSSLNRRLDVFSSLIEFYLLEKSPGKIDKLYISGGGCEILGIDKHISSYLNVETLLIDKIPNLEKKIKHMDLYNFKYFLGVFGLSKRKEL